MVIATRKPGRPTLLTRLFWIGLLIFSLVGCGQNKTTAPDSATLLANTAKRLDAVKAVHFTVAIDGEAYIDTGRTVQLRSANGDIVTPDQMQTKIRVAVGPANVDVQLITIGGDRYQTDLLTGRWGPAQPGFDYSPTVLFDKSQGLSTVIVKLRDVRQLADEKVGGQDAYHVQGKVDRALVEPMTSGAIDGDPITVDLWIDKADSNLVKLVLTEPQVPNKAKPAVWTLTFEKYDQPVTITRPQ